MLQEIKKSTTVTKLKSAEHILDIYIGNCNNISTICDALKLNMFLKRQTQKKRLVFS